MIKKDMEHSKYTEDTNEWGMDIYGNETVTLFSTYKVIRTIPLIGYWPYGVFLKRHEESNFLIF